MAKSLMQKLTNLQLSAEEVRINNPAWTDEMVLDYIGKTEDLKTIAEAVSSLVDNPLYQRSSQEESVETLQSVIATRQPEENDIIYQRLREGNGVTAVYTGTQVLSNGQTVQVNIGGGVSENAVLILNTTAGYVAERFSGTGAYYVAANIEVGGQILPNRTQIELVATNIQFLLGTGNTESADATTYWTVIDYGD